MILQQFLFLILLIQGGEAAEAQPRHLQLSYSGRQRQADMQPRDRPTEWHHCRESGTKREECWRAGRSPWQTSAAIWTPGSHRLPSKSGSMFCGESTFCIFYLFCCETQMSVGNTRKTTPRHGIYEQGTYCKPNLPRLNQWSTSSSCINDFLCWN